jgi:aminoglycoside phosphotransferase (APT) family kinase protein
MGREFSVLSQVKKYFDKVPQTFINCTDQRVLGFPFYIMQRIIGIILRPKKDNSFSIKEETFSSLSKTFIDTLVHIHSIDLESSSMLSLGRPAGYVQRQVEGWTKRYVNAQTDSLLAMNQVAEWLSQNIPNSQKRSLIHNDYKYDNLVLNPTDITEIIGVLDWEMATVGDPLMDLGAALAYWPQAEDDAIDKSFNLTWLPGNWTRIQLAEYYASLTGTDISQIVFYYVFGLYKNAVIAQQIYSRWKKGFSQDPRFGTLIHVVKSLSAKAIDAIKKQKI